MVRRECRNACVSDEGEISTCKQEQTSEHLVHVFSDIDTKHYEVESLLVFDASLRKLC